MKAVIHKTGAIGEVLGIERRDDGIDYVYFESGLCKPISEVGFLNPYEQYMEDWSDWEDFRREIAMNMLSVTAMMKITKDSATVRMISKEGAARLAIEYADELIKQLKEK